MNDSVDSKNGSPNEDVRDYFTAFLKKDPDGTVVDEFVMGLNTCPLNQDGAAYLHSCVNRFKRDSKNDNTTESVSVLFERKPQVVHGKSNITILRVRPNLD